MGGYDDDAREPPVPPGLKALTPAQDELAAFLGIDTYLLDAAASKSAPLTDNTAEQQAWVLGLTKQAKDAWLLRALAEPDVGAALRHEFRATTAKPAPAHAGRTIADLWRRAEALQAKK